MIHSLWKKYGEFVAVSLVSFVIVTPILTYCRILVFQDRDWARALDILKNGTFYFWSSETMGGGHIPGALYYYLMAIAAYFGADWNGIWYLSALFFSIGVAMAWVFFHHHFNLFTAIVSAALFHSSYMLLSRHVFIMNPTFLFPFVVGALISILKAYENPKELNLKWWCIHFLCIGLGSQFHLSINMFLLASLPLCFYYSGRFCSGLKYISIGIFFLLIPLVCFLIAAALSSHHLAYPDTTGEGNLIDSWKYLEGLFTSAPHLNLSSLTEIIHNFERLFPYFMWPVIGFVFLTKVLHHFSITSNHLQKIGVKTKPTANLWLMFFYLLSSVAPLFSFLFFTHPSRYLICFATAFIFIMSLLISMSIYIPKNKVVWQYLQAAIVIALIFTAYFENFDAYDGDPSLDRSYPTNVELTAVFSNIKKDTNWSFEEVRKHLFVLDFNAEFGYHSLY